jgi:hypothetical protein
MRVQLLKLMVSREYIIASVAQQMDVMPRVMRLIHQQLLLNVA